MTATKVINQWAKVEFEGIEEIDAACCHSKVDVDIFGDLVSGNVKAQPLDLYLNEKRNPGGLKCRKGIRTPDVHIKSRDRKEGTLRPPPSPDDVEWSPIPPAEADGSSEGEGGSGSEDEDDRREEDERRGEERREEGNDDGREEELAMGYIELRCGAAPFASDATSIIVPWRTLRTSPRAQLRHVAACLDAAGFEVQRAGGGIQVLCHRPTLLPVVGFRIGANLAGRDFPWHWVVGLWPADSAHQDAGRPDPVAVTSTTVAQIDSGRQVSDTRDEIPPAIFGHAGIRAIPAVGDAVDEPGDSIRPGAERARIVGWAERGGMVLGEAPLDDA